jgi:hypothetical protein
LSIDAHRARRDLHLHHLEARRHRALSRRGQATRVVGLNQRVDRQFSPRAVRKQARHADPSPPREVLEQRALGGEARRDSSVEAVGRCSYLGQRLGQRRQGETAEARPSHASGDSVPNDASGIASPRPTTPSYSSATCQPRRASSTPRAVLIG